MRSEAKTIERRLTARAVAVCAVALAITIGLTGGVSDQSQPAQADRPLVLVFE